MDVTFLTTADETGRDLLFGVVERGSAFDQRRSDRSARAGGGGDGGSLRGSVEPVGPTFEPRFTTSAFRAAAILIVAGTLLFPAKAWADDSSAVLERYSAGLADRGLDTGSVTVEIEGSVARLDKRARVEAIRTWAGGKRAYQFVTVEGDSFVRNEMIARYFAMDTEGEPMAAGDHRNPTTSSSS